MIPLLNSDITSLDYVCRPLLDWKNEKIKTPLYKHTDLNGTDVMNDLPLNCETDSVENVCSSWQHQWQSCENTPTQLFLSSDQMSCILD